MFDLNRDHRGDPLLLGRPGLGAAVGLVFSCAEFTLCAIAAISGHGSYLPAMLVFGGPPPIGVLAWTTIGALLGWRVHRAASIAGLLVLGANFAGFLVVLHLAGPAFSVTADLRRVGLAGLAALFGWAVAFVVACFLFVESFAAGDQDES